MPTRRGAIKVELTSLLDNGIVIVLPYLTPKGKIKKSKFYCINTQQTILSLNISCLSLRILMEFKC